MKSQFLVYFFAFFTFFSCQNQREETTELNSFLESNYEFNFRVLNQNRGNYYQRIEEQPYRAVDKIDQLDSKFELLIANIDRAIANKENNLEKIISDFQIIMDEIPEIVDYRKNYLQTEFDYIEKIKTDSNKFYLNCLKNRLVIAISYAFEYSVNNWTDNFDGLLNVNVNSYFSQINENGIKLSLTSAYGQTIRENRRIIINKIEFNGNEKKINYELKDNFSFTDIEFDSLQKGSYQINGILRYYERDEKIDIPINEKFEVE